MWGWLPKVYYDLMARVLPGATIVLGALYLKHGPLRGFNFVLRIVCEPELSWVCRAGVMLVASYVIGLIVGEMGELVAGRMLERRDAENELVLMRECFDDHARSVEAAGAGQVTMAPDELPSVAVMGEQIAVVDRHSDGRLLAVRAERRLCHVMGLGMFLLALGNLMMFAGDLIPIRMVVEGGLILSILVLWRRSTRLHERHVRKVCLTWLMNFAGAAGPEA